MNPAWQAGWRLVLDESWRGECEAARVASDERTRLALNKIRRFDNILPGREKQAYVDMTEAQGGLVARVRIFFDDGFSGRAELVVRGEGG